MQSSYVPWKGYFDLINSVDEFILYDDRQYTRRDWRSRNRIKTAQGITWLTIPVRVKGRFTQRIDETEIADRNWPERHWNTVLHAYAAAPSFDSTRGLIQQTYEQSSDALLTFVNQRWIVALCSFLGIGTRISRSSEYRAVGTRSERLVSLCLAAGASHYLTGPTARAYIDERLFHEAGIEVEYFDYSGYPVYDQLYPPFEHTVSILDLIAHTGRNAFRFLKSFTIDPGHLDAT